MVQVVVVVDMIMEHLTLVVQGTLHQHLQVRGILEELEQPTVQLMLAVEVVVLVLLVEME